MGVTILKSVQISGKNIQKRKDVPIKGRPLELAIYSGPG